ncbi:thioredoxin TrxA [Microbulbifer sp. EKSA008]|uniref:thioredoxin TrxA n=1 Tax=unclassified Microbulbifer TaxID=2619833 RepID=UPI0024AD323B|nr:thioredoxin TrxA [Microbulbifer sp. VAAF005]WHI44588.1 thioredoxin TrxA [Microbulbifer sp. VAAF005]WNZ56620.1 thioredoxin TrxA [Microbulbifer sp. MKSA007]
MSEHSIVNVSDAEFEAEVLKAEGPVLVDFWAQWCGPCKMIAPVLEDLAGHYGDKLKIVKVDVDANKESPAKYNVRGIPTLLLFKGGNVEGTKVGALSRAQLTEFIDGQL